MLNVFWASDFGFNFVLVAGPSAAGLAAVCQMPVLPGPPAGALEA